MHQVWSESYTSMNCGKARALRRIINNGGTSIRHYLVYSKITLRFVQLDNASLFSTQSSKYQSWPALAAFAELEVVRFITGEVAGAFSETDISSSETHSRLGKHPSPNFRYNHMACIICFNTARGCLPAGVQHYCLTWRTITQTRVNVRGSW